MIRYLSGEEKLKSRDLWEEAFPEDSRPFADYYFAEKLKDNRILVREEEGQLASMIHLNPYRIQAAGRQWTVDYLVGVATRRTCRHRGYMRSLLLKMMADMREEGMPFCFLMPADEAIYRPFGFTYIFRQPFYQLKPGVKLEQREVILRQGGAAESRFLTEAAAWMNRWLEDRYEVFVVRDLAYVKRLLKELASEKGSFRLLYDQQRLVGMVSDWGLEEREQRLLYCQEAYAREVRPPKPAIMARIITPEVFARAVRLKKEYPGEEAVIRLRLSDPLIPENDGWWRWHLNRESSWMERVDQAAEISAPKGVAGGRADNAEASAVAKVTAGDRSDNSEASARAKVTAGDRADETEAGGAGLGDREMADAGCYELALTVEELAAWLFGYQVPEWAGALEMVVRPLQGVFLDEIV